MQTEMAQTSNGHKNEIDSLRIALGNAECSASNAILDVNAQAAYEGRLKEQGRKCQENNFNLQAELQESENWRKNLNKAVNEREERIVVLEKAQRIRLEEAGQQRIADSESGGSDRSNDRMIMLSKANEKLTGECEMLKEFNELKFKSLKKDKDDGMS